MFKRRFGTFLSWLVILGSIALAFYVAPIPQDPSYHNFSDQRELFNIVNFYDVVSNAAFLLVGLYGSYHFYFRLKLGYRFPELQAYRTYYIGIFLVALGSAYYHLDPSNQTLVWDRLPMTIAFMALFSMVIGEYISSKLGQALLLPLIVCGAISVFYWWFGEIQGKGDLRLYILVQFIPLLLIPIILLFFGDATKNSRGYWMLLLAYFLAKLLEYFDANVFTELQYISGHSLKHIVAAIGTFWLLKYQIIMHTQK